MQQSHISLEIIMRLPSGHSDLQAKLGGVIQAAREEKGISRKVLAHDVGIRREALSRIENGKQMPRSRLLEALVLKLGIEWEPVVIEIQAVRPAREFEEGTRERALEHLANDIYQRRKAERLSLRALSKRLRISAAQLSRIERGQMLHSRIFRDHPDDLVNAREERRIQITDCRVRAFIRN
jgi:transcriptional regulator with XRE-family HTH domain